jgi:hypothetical protein
MLHRMEMWEEAESKLLQTIEVDSATIHWTKRNRELILNNEYFDVVKMEYKNGKAILTGVFDKEEKELHEVFARNQNKENEPVKTTRKIADWLQLLWTYEDSPAAAYPTVNLKKSYPFSRPALLLKSGKQPPVPPPWLC